MMKRLSGRLARWLAKPYILALYDHGLAHDPERVRDGYWMGFCHALTMLTDDLHRGRPFEEDR